ncbi:MAG: hypothetical protein GTN38_02720 [Candidatus Aenigmarchaeota archaeon]|nr:hypothetical protein [Candidatus Aenigmarchaeota archaeon]NIP40550.1 hypothetical protein [Candidatus Aenigmarchaeota archaeon]NIQ18395.1 hypothetical protein [Candidatus Aenigmarchaeota archaeon]
MRTKRSEIFSKMIRFLECDDDRNSVTITQNGIDMINSNPENFLSRFRAFLKKMENPYKVSEWILRGNHYYRSNLGLAERIFSEIKDKKRIEGETLESFKKFLSKFPSQYDNLFEKDKKYSNIRPQTPLVGMVYPYLKIKNEDVNHCFCSYGYWTNKPFKVGKDYHQGPVLVVGEHDSYYVCIPIGFKQKKALPKLELESDYVKNTKMSGRFRAYRMRVCSKRSPLSEVTCKIPGIKETDMRLGKEGVYQAFIYGTQFERIGGRKFKGSLISQTGFDRADVFDLHPNIAEYNDSMLDMIGLL